MQKVRKYKVSSKFVKATISNLHSIGFPASEVEKGKLSFDDISTKIEAQSFTVQNDIVVFLLDKEEAKIGFNQVYAQQATTASGGDASGSGGSVAHSVGQTVYTTNTGSNGSVAQGVEQPYEISITTGLAETGINLIFTCLSQSNNKLFDVAN